MRAAKSCWNAVRHRQIVARHRVGAPGPGVAELDDATPLAHVAVADEVEHVPRLVVAGGERGPQRVLGRFLQPLQDDPRLGDGSLQRRFELGVLLVHRERRQVHR